MSTDERIAWHNTLKQKYRLSPMHQLLGLELIEVAEGRVAIEFSARPEIRNMMNEVHGGALASAIDSGLMQAVRSTLKEGDFLATTELKVNFVRPGRGEVFRCEAEAVHIGRSTGVVQGKVLDQKGEVVAVGLGTIFIRRKE